MTKYRKRAALTAAILGLAAATFFFVDRRWQREAHIVVNPGITHQTWHYNMMMLAATPAWGATEPALNASWDAGLKTNLINQLVNQLGINTLQLTEPSGDIEKDRDCWTETNILTHSLPGWYACRYAPVSAGADAGKFYCADANLVHCPQIWPMASLDYQYDKYISGADGMAALLSGKGERLHIVFQYIHWPASPTYLDQTPAYVGRQIVAAFIHIRSKYGAKYLPDAIDMMVEPDGHCVGQGQRRGPLGACDGRGGSWNYASLGNAGAAAASRLREAGFQVCAPHDNRPGCIQVWGPSTSRSDRAVGWFNGLESVAGPIFGALTTHWYDAPSSPNGPWNEIARTAAAKGICPVMDEYTDMGATDLYELMAVYGVCGAEKYTAATIGMIDNGSTYLNITNVTPYKAHYTGPHTSARSPAWFFPQYMQYIRDGDVREDAASDNSNFTPVAFRSASGNDKVVVRVTGTGDQTVDVTGVAAGTYRCTYTYNNDALLRPCGTNQTIGSGGVLKAQLQSIPRSRKGVTTAVVTFDRVGGGH